MLIIRGDLVTFDDDHRVVPKGRILVDDDGRIAKILGPGDQVPDTFSAARSVDFDGFVYPGLVDCHNHIPYNTIGLWGIPTRPDPFVDHNEWTKPVVYNRQITAPQKFLGWAAGPSLLAYVETKAMLGGTTTIQGSGRFPAVEGVLVRNVDSERFGTASDKFRVDTLVKREVSAFDSVRTAMRDDKAGYFYHLAEGIDRSTMGPEWKLAKDGGVVQLRFVAIHGTGLLKSELKQLATAKATLIWSPFSNMWLYGATADVITARALGLRLCLGSDWAPSGTRNVLGELKVAKLWNKDPSKWHRKGASVPDPPTGGVFTDRDLCDLVTRNPGEAVANVYGPQIGRIQELLLADLIFVRRNHNDPYTNLIRATEPDVELVMIGGEARCGTAELIATCGTKSTTTVKFASGGKQHERRVLIRNPKNTAKTMTWSAILKRLKFVRDHPEEADQELASALASAAAGGESVFIVEGDMPFGNPGDDALAAAGPGQKPDPVEIPPFDPLCHESTYFDAVDANSYHRGLLSPLRDFYPES
ncbi:MAG: amidohydrolase family protein [Aeromicrobium sp.]